MQTYTIYKLIEPDMGIAFETVRYIGITKYKLSRRLVAHLREKTNIEKWNWIQELKRQGKKPVIKAIVKLEFGDFYAFDRFLFEKHYIRKYKTTVFNKDLNPLVSKPNKNKGKKFKHLHTADLRTKALGNDKKV